MKKYELTDVTICLGVGKVHRIRAVRDFGKVKRGDLGGFVQSEENLSHYGTCWVGDKAIAYAHSFVDGDAIICDNALVFGHAMVSGHARVGDHTRVCDYAEVYDNAKILGCAMIHDHAEVFDDAMVYGLADVGGFAKICGVAKVRRDFDYMLFRNTWSSGRWFTYMKSTKMWKVGCFHGTGEALIKKAYSDSEMSGRGYGAIVNAVMKIEEAMKK